MQLLRDGECVLRVRQASRHEDAGRYSCCASNVVGRDICSAEVYVEGAQLVDSTSYITEEAMNKINLVTRSVSWFWSAIAKGYRRLTLTLTLTLTPNPNPNPDP